MMQVGICRVSSLVVFIFNFAISMLIRILISYNIGAYCINTCHYKSFLVTVMSHHHVPYGIMVFMPWQCDHHVTTFCSSWHSIVVLMPWHRDPHVMPSQRPCHRICYIFLIITTRFTLLWILPWLPNFSFSNFSLRSRPSRMYTGSLCNIIVFLNKVW